MRLKGINVIAWHWWYSINNAGAIFHSPVSITQCREWKFKWAIAIYSQVSAPDESLIGCLFSVTAGTSLWGTKWWESKERFPRILCFEKSIVNRRKSHSRTVQAVSGDSIVEINRSRRKWRLLRSFQSWLLENLGSCREKFQESLANQIDCSAYNKSSESATWLIHFYGE